MQRPWVGVLVLAVTLAGCSGSGNAPATTTPLPGTGGTPAVGRAPVLVYSFETPFSQRHGNVDVTVVAFDTATWRELHRTVFPSTGFESPVLTSRGVVVYFRPLSANGGFELRELDPMTGADGVLYSSTKAIEYSIAVSPDGGSVAFTDVAPPGGGNSSSEVRLLNIDGDKVRTLAAFTHPIDGTFHGIPVPRAWRDDGKALIVSGDTSNDAPGTWASILLDGTTTSYGVHAAYLSPDGRTLAIEDSPDYVCPADVPQDLKLLDLASDHVVAEVVDPNRGIRDWGNWSPAGDGVLYSQLDSSQIAAECRGTTVDEVGQAFLLSVHGGPPVPVPDPLALRRNWYGDQIIDFECDGETTFDPYGNCPMDRGTMYLDGRAVTSGEVMRVLGFMDVRQ